MLEDLVGVVENHDIRSIAIPPLGAGNGGLDWSDVEPLIREALGSIDGLDVRLYPPTRQHRSIQGEPVSMTWPRAVLIQLIQAYVAKRQAAEPWEDQEGASALEIQKLMYFARLYEPRLGLDFARGRYGPYSEQVRHLLQDMEGSYLQGLGDGSDRVLDLAPVAPTDSGRRAASDVPRQDVIENAVVRPTLAAVNGFEGPYGIELLASAHWVAAIEGTADPVAVSTAVTSWTKRKAQLFGPAPIADALAQLRRVGLLPTAS